MTTDFIQFTEYPEAKTSGVRELQMHRYVDCLTGKVYTTSTVSLDDRGFSITSKGADERRCRNGSSYCWRSYPRICLQLLPSLTRRTSLESST